MEVVKMRTKTRSLPFLAAGIMSLAALVGCERPVTQPRLESIPSRPIIYRVDEGNDQRFFNQRFFKDNVPYGSLDSVIIYQRVKGDWQRMEIQPGSAEFVKQEKVYKSKIRPLYIDEQH